MLKIYYDNDADLGILKDKTVAVIGYGIQGRGQAL
ncbi:MAG: ketol-acid reductoisomerase, partial [Candidatus Omnitrophica bacterium]|nr:ketol-acid reductoisomerase [Candidatus Omnitrophota bacterium]